MLLIHNILALLFFISLTAIILHSMNDFLNRKYLLLKSLGMKSAHIFQTYLKDNDKKIILAMGTYCFILPKSEYYVAVLQVLWFVMFCYCGVKFLYIISHWKYLYYFLLAILQILAVILCCSTGKCIYLNARRINSIETLFEYICESKVTDLLLQFLFYPSCIVIFITILLILAEIPIMFLTDNRIAEIGRKKILFGKGRINIFHTSKKRSMYLANHIIKEVFLCFRKKENLVSFLFLYTCYIFVVFIVHVNDRVFVCITAFFLSFLCLGTECFYHADRKCLEWYMLLGQPYEKFLRYKCYVSLAISGVIYLAGCLKFSRMSLCLAGLFFYFMYSVIYWNLYFGCYFTKMREGETFMEIVGVFLVWILFYIPAVNILLCVYWYKKGKERWNQCLK